MVPLRASALVDAPEGAVRRAFRRIELWTRTGVAAGIDVEVQARDRSPRGRLAPGDLLALRPRSAAWRLRAGDRRVLLRVESDSCAGGLWVPRLRAFGGPLGRCDIELQAVGTGAGTSATVTCRLDAGAVTAALRRPVLATEQTLLGIATLIAREPVVVVAAAIVRAGRVLAARRAPDAAGTVAWELPGGKVEPDEEEPVALAREIHEELVIAVEVRERIGPDVDLGDNRILRCYLATAKDEPMPTEHEEVCWLAADELDAIPWLDADRALLPALRAVLTAP